MRKVFGLVLMVFFVVTCVFAEEEFTIRGLRWGDSVERVLEVEGKPLGRQTKGLFNSLLYRKKVGGYDAYILFAFFDNQLMSVMYSYDVKHTNKNLYIDDYKTIKKLLLKKYKQPTLDKVIWKNDLYKDDPEHYGFAVSLGHLTYITNWKLPEKDTTILHALTGDNFKITLGTVYVCDSLNEKYDRWKETQNKDEF